MVLDAGRRLVSDTWLTPLPPLEGLTVALVPIDGRLFFLDAVMKIASHQNKFIHTSVYCNYRTAALPKQYFSLLRFKDYLVDV